MYVPELIDCAVNSNNRLLSKDSEETEGISSANFVPLFTGISSKILKFYLLSDHS